VDVDQHVQDKIAEYIARYTLNPDQARVLHEFASGFAQTDTDRLQLVHGVFGSGKRYPACLVESSLVI
jgi:hypothetical protein